jgi:Methyltransferase domain
MTSLRALVPRPVKSLLRPTVMAAKKWRDRRNRIKLAMTYYRHALDLVDVWASQDTELSNFYYDLADLNRRHLAGLISTLTAVPPQDVEKVFGELDTDTMLREHLTRGAIELGYPKDVHFRFGRRLGWYAMVRLKTPRVVIETGVDDGVGSCVLCAALRRNAADGHAGRYYGTEIRREAGKLFQGPYTEFGEIVYGDSISTLQAFGNKIDLFVNDSDHSGDYEYREYRTIADKLSRGAVILGDNSHVTDSLCRFAWETGRSFIFFREVSKDHWYPGAGIGFAFERGSLA